MKKRMMKVMGMFAMMTVLATAMPQIAEARTVATTPKGIADFALGDAEMTIYGNEGQSLKGKEFELYRLFHVDNAEGGESVNYKINEQFEDAMQTVVGKRLSKAPEKVTEYEIIDYIQSLNNNQVEGAQTPQTEEGRYSDYRYFVEELRNEIVKENAFGDTVKVTGTTDKNTVEITGLKDGYYIVDETSRVGGTHSAGSLCMVNTANPEADIHIKSDYPVLTKKIREDDNWEKIGNSGWNDIGDYEIGQTVPYKYESNIPDMNGYDTYYYAWHDIMDEALTFHKDSVGIKIYESDEQSKSYTLKKDEFKVITNPGDGETFQVEVKDMKAIVDREFNRKNDLDENVYGQKVVLTYNAALNDKAAEDTGRPGFENDVRLEFSNDADHAGDGSTGYTPWDTVVCFTYKINLLKTNNHDLKLEGAKFRLYSDKALKNEVYVKKTANGYNVINRDSLGGTDHIGGKAPADAVEMVSPEDGTFVIYGLDDGIYYLKETEAPKGYRPLLDPIVLNLKATFTDERNEYVKGDGAADKILKNFEATAHIKEFLEGAYKESEIDLTTDINEGSANITVVNTVGKKLPVTGSSTALIMLGAGIVIVTGSAAYMGKKRKSNQK